MPKPPSMQEVIMRLHEFWAAHGCTIWQPYSEKVGAGTMNPATVLRVLGPEPWNVAYVEPSFRPDDGRYAENPNRMQMHHQYQVILKPDPGNPQELYLASLEAIGLDRTRHDIRFVEDNWESPALGAWGLGWEVWLDGQEITQFTYFQQAGSLPLDPVSVEITYGLDRIVMYLQHKTQVWDIDVDGQHTFAELYRDPEVEHCVYDFELADVERMKQLYAIYKAEAEACIARGLIIPAHDYVLRQSHTFNLLDARGAIGVTERAKFFADMRAQAKAVSELYVEQRRKLEFPWLTEGEKGRGGEVTQSPISNLPISTPQSFLLELGSEELPPQDVVDGIAQIEEKLKALLAQYKLSYEGLRVTGTPRRLVAFVSELAPIQADEVVEKRGPALAQAYDSLNQPTKALEGFARGQGMSVDQLEVRDNYVYAVKRVAGRPAAEVLPQLCLDLLNALRWGKAMRWNSSGIAYSRPLRWIVALFGEQVVPFTWAGVASSNTSRGPRFADAAARLPAGGFTTFTIKDAQSYFDAVAAEGVVVDREERRQLVAELVQQAAASIGGNVPDEAALLDEVTDLVEAPQALLGTFEAKYLELPAPVLIGVMKKHQRYFPVLKGGALVNHFVTVANSNELAHPDVVREGNEGVIRARYADAAYFYRADTTRPLESYSPRLATLTFHAKLGSMLDRVERLKALAPQIAEMLGASAEEIAAVTRAAALSKADLMTSMVIEMTSLQGIMGEIYALKSGETPAVAQAIREQYLPRFAGDDVPASRPGLALALADKLDALSGLFAVKAIPTGSADPFGLRRAALGIVNSLIATQTDFSVRAGLEAAAKLQPVAVSAEATAETAAFVERRLQGVLADQGFAFDVVEAVLAVRGDNPTAAVRACAALSKDVSQGWWSETFTAYARCARITRSLTEELPLNQSAYTEAVEHALHVAYVAAEAALKLVKEPADILGETLRALQLPINAYFERVLVNAEDETLRRARLALVQRIAQLPAQVADLSKLQGF
ncbi:MAG TPA: glycine--tRNA ligase subunit alpha/beta [Chloroflexi bacterium]|nr:glycine--tRNA ligase subunit alpha/beta [Chloroflexota bacterium]HHW86697.1 glycine--tRNA ligase subunit beta [Chloroflexota bacterium]